MKNSNEKIVIDYIDRKYKISKRNSVNFFLKIFFIYLYLFIIYESLEFINLSLFGVVLAVSDFMLIGFGQYVLAQSLHEAWHFYFRGFKKILSIIFISYPLGIPDDARASHFLHHRYLGDPNLDPDYAIYNKVISKKMFWMFVLNSVTGLSAIKRFFELLIKDFMNIFCHAFTFRNLFFII